MQYFGGKQRISKDLSEFLNEQIEPINTFVDLFCGSCNIISKITATDKRIANDKHFYLIKMFQALQKGWIPPNVVSEEEYQHYKNNPNEFPHITGFIGFACSFSGKWFGGYARNNRNRNYCLDSKNSLMRKLKKLENVVFLNLDYRDFVPIKNSIIYCDIPYKNSTPYARKEVGIFNHNDFYQWIIKTSEIAKIYVSEYIQNVPEYAKIVWEIDSRKDIRNKNNELEKTKEVLFTI